MVTQQKYSFFERLFSRWSKWELDKENIKMRYQEFNSPILGSRKINEYIVLVDRYVSTNKFTGLKRYKEIEKGILRN